MDFRFDATPFAELRSLAYGATTSDPWQDYSSRKKGPPHPVVPEPGSYGLAMVALCVVVLGLRRWARSKAG